MKAQKTLVDYLWEAHAFKPFVWECGRPFDSHLHSFAKGDGHTKKVLPQLQLKH